MKKQLLLLTIIGACFGAQAQKRYLEEVFTSFTVTPVIYDTNIWVPPFSGLPTVGPRPLTGAFYAPTGDTSTSRPLIIYMHTGSFLPAVSNQQTTGNINDSTVVEMARRFVKRGFVVMPIGYRQGWNPATDDANVATGQLLNATYRAVQDAKNAIRYARANAAALGIDTSRIILGGQGTGGYASFASATLDKYSEITLGKFISTANSLPHVDTTLSGDWNGLGGTALNIPGNASIPTNFHFAFNLGGAMGDSIWLEKGDVPMVSFHCANDPFAPYGRGNVIVPGATPKVVIQNASGSKVVIDKANRIGNNDAINAKQYPGPIEERALVASEGTANLFTFRFSTPLQVQGSPWEWWDRAFFQQGTPAQKTADSLSNLTNLDMSAAKAKAYIDTIQAFLVPRIVVALNLPGKETFINTSVKEIANVSQHLTVFPNPASEMVNVSLESKAGQAASYQVVDITGRTVLSQQVNSNEFSFPAMGINPGLYFVHLSLKDGNIATKRVVIK